MYLGPKETVATRHTLNPSEKWSFTSLSFYQYHQSLKTSFQTKEHVPRVQWQSFRKVRIAVLQTCSKLVINELLARTRS